MNTPTMSKEKHSDFGRKLISVLRQVRPYVKHRLYTAETIGIVPRNMYSTSGIIDDAVVKLYENNNGNFEDQNELKLELFKLVSQQIDKLFIREEFHIFTMSTSKVLKKELELMEEDFTMDIDNDLLMKEDLDDISYRQKHVNEHELLYDESEKSIIKTFDLHDEIEVFNEDKRKALNKVYNWIPYETSNIVDLLVFGKLKYKEIAWIKGLRVDEVKKSIQAVSNNFRKNLN